MVFNFFQISDKIKCYFERLGEIESVDVRAQGDFQYCYVQFKRAIDAEMVVFQASHSIENCAVKVKAADEWLQPDYIEKPIDIWLLPPEQGSKSHILVALNDDCLQEVFKRLAILDLTRVAEVCTHFNQQAINTFESKYKHLDLQFGSNFTGRPEALQSMFTNFGSSIQSLSVEAWASESESFIIDMIKRNCAKTLKDLKLRAFYFEGNFTDLQPIFVKLEKMHLEDCTCYVPNFLDGCTEMQVLRLEDCTFNNEDRCIEKIFPKLEAAHFISNVGIGDQQLESFICLNPTLVKLTIINNCNLDTAQALRFIGQNMTNLHELEFDEKIDNLASFHSDAQNLNQLTSLRVLRLNFNGQSIEPLMNALSVNEIPIEDLKVSNARVGAIAVDGLCQLTQIKKLELCEVSGLTEELFVELAKGLPQLQELHAIENYELTTIGLKKMVRHANRLTFLKLESIPEVTIDIDDYKMMLKTVQDRPEKIKLLIDLTGDGEMVNVPEAVLAENRSIFFIDEKVIEHENEAISGDSNDSFGVDDDSWADEYDEFDHFSDADSEDGLDIGVINGQRFYLG